MTMESATESVKILMSLFPQSLTELTPLYIQLRLELS